MGDTELIQYRIQQNEKDNLQLKQDILEIKNALGRMEAKLQLIPDNGLNCPVHDIRMTEYNKRLESVETKLETVHTKIISWTAIASVILFLVSSFLVPYIQKHMNEHTTNNKVGLYERFPNPSPYVFFYETNINSFASTK